MGAPRIAPTIFDEGAVGLRIVAAMIESGRPVMGKLKSDPIPIRPRVVGPTTPPKAEVEEEDEDDDVGRSESYTCVIEREGGKTVRTTVYYDSDGIEGKFEMNSGVFFESPPGAVGPIPADFLSCCYLCWKKLHGLDIFMYRGEKAFCSVECRCQQIISDEQKEKFRSKTGKPRDSPLSSTYLSPLTYDAGVAAAYLFTVKA